MILSLISNLKNQKGFNLIGIVVALTISAAIFSGAFLVYKPTTDIQFHEKTMVKLDRLQLGINLFKEHRSGTPPASLDSLVDTDGPPCALDKTRTSLTFLEFSGWCGPYVNRGVRVDDDDFKRDAWGNLIQYNVTTLRSCGPNNTCGDGDDLVRNL